ncbi:beta-N-acetylhexosaminidase [Gemmatimonadota bacterium]
MKRSISLILMLLAVFSVSGLRAADTMLWREGINLIPSPQESSLRGENFVFKSLVSIVLDGSVSEADKFAAADLAARLESEHCIKAVVSSEASGKTIILTHSDAPEKLGEQGYEIEVGKDRITIRAAGEAGLFYGTRTLLQIIQQGPGDKTVKGLKITDWPDIPIRAVHYDTKHFQEKFEYVQEFICTLARYKINMLIWEWEDKFAYQRHPEIGAPGAFTMKEMQEITRYARKYHIQVVPLVQGLGHVSYILKWPQNAHLREIPASNWEFCPLKDGSYDLLFDLWEEAIAATPGSEYMHIGSDETFELGRGPECGCAERMKEIGRYPFYMSFINRCADFVTSRGRKYIAWTPPYRPDEKVKPDKGGPLMAERLNLEIAKQGIRDGYTHWVYTPNPGIEHLFLPYFYRDPEDKRHPGTAIENAYETLTTASLSGLYDGMVATSWNCSGVHNQIWMLRYIIAAEYSWIGKAPDLEEFKTKYFKNYYGPACQDLPELFLLLSKGSYYYMDTFERKVWHWGLSGVYADGRNAYVGKTHLPDLPRDDAIEYDPFWNYEYKEILDRSRAELPMMQRVLTICRTNLELGVKNSYDFELFSRIAELFEHTARTCLAISELEKAVGEAHRQHFVSHEAAYRAFERAEGIIKNNLADREQVFTAIKATWEKTQLPKGMSTPEKKYFYAQDRGRNQANRRADLSFMICDEELLGLEDYLSKLRLYMNWYRKTYL